MHPMQQHQSPPCTTATMASGVVSDHHNNTTNNHSSSSPPPSPNHGNKVLNTAVSFLLSRIRSFAYYTSRALEAFAVVYNFISTRVHPFWIEFAYYTILALVASLILMLTTPKVRSFDFAFLDILYMTVSAVTVSGLNSIETEIFSEFQIMVLAFLMFFGGEVFVSFLTLYFRRAPVDSTNMSASNISLPVLRIGSSNRIDSIEIVDVAASNQSMATISEVESGLPARFHLKQRALRYLDYVVLAYFVCFHLLGFTGAFVYYKIFTSAEDVLKGKGITTATFVWSTIFSSFANGGLIYTNENMGRFKGNSGLLLMLITLILCGNTLYPATLRLVLWVLHKTTKKPEFELMLKNPAEMDYPHIFSLRQTLSISLTTATILCSQLVLYASMNWDSDPLSGLNSYQKIVGVFFMATNSRHSGESVFDLSVATPAVILLFTAMMYMTPYTSFEPVEGKGKVKTHKNFTKKESKTWKGNWRKLKKNLNVSMLSYVVFFIIVACIVERQKLKNDPLNFSTLHMAFETMSAYGNVGLSMGYSCSRLITPDATCVDKTYSFSGKWSNGGKFLIIFVMLFGRLKRYHMGGGKAWKLK